MHFKFVSQRRRDKLFYQRFFLFLLLCWLHERHGACFRGRENSDDKREPFKLKIHNRMAFLLIIGVEDANEGKITHSQAEVI